MTGKGGGVTGKGGGTTRGTTGKRGGKGGRTKIARGINSAMGRASWLQSGIGEHM